MSSQEFAALIVTELPDGSFKREIGRKTIDELPDGEVLVSVCYSSLNYKDMLSATGNKGVTRRYPHTPGIDAAGLVESSDSDLFALGQEVIVTGHDLGMNTSGGFGEYIRVPADWVVPLPPRLSLRESMILGTAGFTAAQSVKALEDGGITPGSGPILVTGATGGVGSLATCILAKLGYEVTIATGKAGHPFVQQLGAAAVISREDALVPPERMLGKSTWAGVVDTVGGAFLDSAIRSTAYRGVVTTCGMVASPKLETNVFPFILRGVRLQGIDSAECPMEQRKEIWAKLSGPWKPDQLEAMATECDLEGLNSRIDLMRQGGQTGRILVVVK